MSTLLNEVSQFLFEEAQLLDERRFRDWLTLFHPQGFYWVPSSPHQQVREGELSIIDEGQAGMLIRIERLEHRAAYTEQPVRRTCRTVANIVIVEESSRALTVRSKLTLHDYRVCDFGTDEARVFCGTQTHGLDRSGDSFAITSKRFDLISSESSLPVLSTPF